MLQITNLIEGISDSYQAISKLLENNCIEELDQKLYCCNTLTVAESKKLRLVLDLCHFNSFIKQNKFRYKNLTTL